MEKFDHVEFDRILSEYVWSEWIVVVGGAYLPSGTIVRDMLGNLIGTVRDKSKDGEDADQCGKTANR